MQTVIALGTFDGMHVGHRNVIRTCVEEARKSGAKSMVYTFTGVPRALFQKAPRMLMTREERRSAMLEMGIDEIVMVDFTEEFAQISPRVFIERLAEAYHPRAFVTGEDYSFGYKASGNAETLRQLGKEMGFQAIIVPQVRVVLPDGSYGEKVSSTMIRRAIDENRPELAKQIAMGNVLKEK